jgi:hypothetical protein
MGWAYRRSSQKMNYTPLALGYVVAALDQMPTALNPHNRDAAVLLRSVVAERKQFQPELLAL